MQMETYLVYLAAVAVFFATPPDTSQLLIISNSVRHGLRRSAYTIAGDLAANSLQMTGAAFGLAAIIATSASAFIWIKWLGVAYLIWIGVQLLLTGNQTDDVAANASGQSFRLFRQGFVTSMANPFAVVFLARSFPNLSTQQNRCCLSFLSWVSRIWLLMEQSCCCGVGLGFARPRR